MPGRNSFFCSSVPHCSSVGPTSVSPKKSPRIGALALANSSASTTPCMVVSPLPPYSAGQVAQIQPPSNSFFGHVLVERLALGVGHLEALVEPAVRQVLVEPGRDLGAEVLGFGGVGQIHVHIVPRDLTRGSSLRRANRYGDVIDRRTGFTRRSRHAQLAATRPIYRLCPAVAPPQAQVPSPSSTRRS